MTKSSVSARWARSPAKLVITSRTGRFGTLRPAVDSTVSSPAAEVATLSLSSWSVAVGPSSRLPCTVGLTRMPLPMAEGSWKMVRSTILPSFLSSRQYSPRRGTVWYCLWHSWLCSVSPCTPAQLTTTRAAMSPREVCTVKWSPVRSMVSTAVSNWNRQPFFRAFS